MNKHLLVFMQHLCTPTHTHRQTKQIEMIFLPYFSIFSELVHYSKQLLEKKMPTHSIILAQRILWTEEPGGLLSIGSYRVRHNCSDLACMHALEKEMATHSSILAWDKNPRDRGAWWAAIYEVAQSWTRLKRLSRSSKQPHQIFFF